MWSLCDTQDELASLNGIMTLYDFDLKIRLESAAYRESITIFALDSAGSTARLSRLISSNQNLDEICYDLRGYHLSASLLTL